MMTYIRFHMICTGHLSGQNKPDNSFLHRTKEEDAEITMVISQEIDHRGSYLYAIKFDQINTAVNFCKVGHDYILKIA